MLQKSTSTNKITDNLNNKITDNLFEKEFIDKLSIDGDVIDSISLDGDFIDTISLDKPPLDKSNKTSLSKPTTNKSLSKPSLDKTLNTHANKSISNKTLNTHPNKSTLLKNHFKNLINDFINIKDEQSHIIITKNLLTFKLKNPTLVNNYLIFKAVSNHIHEFDSFLYEHSVLLLRIFFDDKKFQISKFKNLKYFEEFIDEVDVRKVGVDEVDVDTKNAYIDIDYIKDSYIKNDKTVINNTKDILNKDTDNKNTINTNLNTTKFNITTKITNPLTPFKPQTPIKYLQQAILTIKQEQQPSLEDVFNNLESLILKSSNRLLKNKCLEYYEVINGYDGFVEQKVRSLSLLGFMFFDQVIDIILKVLKGFECLRNKVVNINILFNIVDMECICNEGGCKDSIYVRCKGEYCNLDGQCKEGKYVGCKEEYCKECIRKEYNINGYNKEECICKEYNINGYNINEYHYVNGYNYVNGCIKKHINYNNTEKLKRTKKIHEVIKKLLCQDKGLEKLVVVNLKNLLEFCELKMVLM